MQLLLLWVGTAGAWLFVIVLLLDGWTRPGYRPVRQPVSALALGTRGWVQTANFLVCGVAITAGAVGLGFIGDSILLAIALGVFGLSLVASGVFPMDPMRGYPPGTPEGDPVKTTRHHRLHDVAGMVVFTSLPVAALIATLSLDDVLWRVCSGIVAAGLTAGFLAFGQAWEDDAPRAGLIQRATIIPGWVWLGALLLHISLR